MITVLPKSLRELYAPTLNPEEAQTKVYEEKILKQDKDFIEKSTTSQADSMAWHATRVGRITASVAYSVLHTNMEKSSESLILKIYTRGQKINTPSIL